MPRDLGVDRGGQTEVQHLADDIGGLEVSGDLGKIAREQAANLVLVHRGRLMFGRQLDQYVGVLRAGAVGLIKREVVRNRQSDIIADALNLRRRNRRADVLLEAIDDVLGVLDAGAARHLDVQAHHAGVNGREEILAGDQQQEHRGDQRDRDASEPEGAARDEHREQLAIAVAEAIEASRRTRARNGPIGRDPRAPRIRCASR